MSHGYCTYLIQDVIVRGSTSYILEELKILFLKRCRQEVNSPAMFMLKRLGLSRAEICAKDCSVYLNTMQC